jgi:hypothetical protein
MASGQLGKLAKRLLPELPGFSAHKSLLLAVPVDHTLRGVLLDRAGDSNRFCVTTFLQPLCVPAKTPYSESRLALAWRVLHMGCRFAYASGRPEGRATL